MELIIGLILCAYAAWEDWKTTIVPDWWTQGGIALGLVYSAGKAWMMGESSIFLGSLGACVVLFAFGSLLYYTGQWGGADTKLLAALGAWLGVSFAFTDPLFAFLLNLMFVGGVYGFVYSMYLGWQHREKTARKISALYIASSRIRFVALGLSGCIMVIAFSRGDILIGSLGAIVLLSYYLYLFTKGVEEGAMVRDVKPRDLIEGDWVMQTIKDGKKIVCSEKDIDLSLVQIKALRQLEKKGKVKTVRIKAGIPFIPAFFFAYLVMLFYGNVLQLLWYAL